jgi:hypothetical protein
VKKEKKGKAMKRLENLLHEEQVDEVYGMDE